jgi:hypothetical protein
MMTKMVMLAGLLLLPITAMGDCGNGNGNGNGCSGQGTVGPQGPAGPQGPIGPQGPQGPQGAQGNAGTNGTNGSVGPTGATSASGTQGAPGAQGVQGPQGPAAEINVPAIDPRLEVEIREYDSRHWSLSSFGSFGMQSGTSRYIVGEKLTLKLGKSYEEREIDRLKRLIH